MLNPLSKLVLSIFAPALRTRFPFPAVVANTIGTVRKKCFDLSMFQTLCPCDGHTRSEKLANSTF